MRKAICCFILTGILISGCAKALVDGTIQDMPAYSRTMKHDPNTLYYATQWAFDQCGYPLGQEDLAAGVVESKWIPVGAASHYIDTVAGKDYGSNAAYYKAVVRIVPVDAGESRVEVETKVNSIVVNMRTTGDKENELLNKIENYARNNDITVTNIGVEE